MTKIAIIGGGASGLAAAIVASKNHQVTVFEMGDRVGKKILASGNGKCNLLHRGDLTGAYNDSRAVSLIERVGEEKIEAFFESIGVPLRVDANNRVYPYAEQSACVLNALRAALTANKVNLRTGVTIEKLEPSANKWTVAGERFDKVIFATGSAATFGRDSLGALRQLGLPIRAFSPSLVPILTDKQNLTGLKGVRVKARATLFFREEPIAESYGEVLFKDNGLSGIAVFDLSGVIARRGAPGCTVKIDLFPDFSAEELSAFLSRGYDGVCHKAILTNVQRSVGLYDTLKIARGLKEYGFKVESLGHMTLAQASSGGVALSALSDTLESTAQKGLYVVGEAVDVDGLCGGYNLTWAWASGMLAGGAV